MKYLVDVYSMVDKVPVAVLRSARDGKVIHVHLLHKIDGTKQKDWYFSSISAVYTVLTADQVGAKQKKTY